MARVVFAASADAGIERLTTFLLEIAETDPMVLIDLLMQTTQWLALQPGMGRPVRASVMGLGPAGAFSAKGPLRELIIDRGHTGYLALYRWDKGHDEVRILSIRHQKEQGYPANP